MLCVLIDHPLCVAKTYIVRRVKVTTEASSFVWCVAA